MELGSGAVQVSGEAVVFEAGPESEVGLESEAGPESEVGPESEGRRPSAR